MKKIEFFSTVDGLTDTYPVTHSKSVLPTWIKTAQQEYSQLKNYDFHIARCPGIVDVLTTGYVVSAWHDIAVRSGPSSLETYAPAVDLEELLEKPVLQVQQGDSIAKHIPKRPWSNKSILKINTPWHIISDCKFMMLPMPYTDQFEFESCIGILDPSVSSEINIQGYVNGHGEFTIRAGTPLCQLVPISQQTYDLKVRDANDHDHKWITRRKYYNSIGFNLNKNIVSKAYNKFFKRK